MCNMFLQILEEKKYLIMSFSSLLLRQLFSDSIFSPYLDTLDTTTNFIFQKITRNFCYALFKKHHVQTIQIFDDALSP